MKPISFLLHLLVLVILLSLGTVSCSSFYSCLDESCKSGKARLVTKICNQYEGEVWNGAPLGFGVMDYTNICVRPGYASGYGDLKTYTGMWAQDKNGYAQWAGKGELVYKSGFRLSADFDNNVPINGSKVSVTTIKGKNLELTWGGRNRYWGCSGSCENGQGASYNIHGDYQEGEYKNGKLNGQCKIAHLHYTTQGTCEGGQVISGVMKCKSPDATWCEDRLKSEVEISSMLLKKQILISNIKLVLTDKIHD